jgi:recombination protein RecA
MGSNSIINKLTKMFNETDVIKFADKDNFNDVVSWIPSGVPSLDFTMGTLGYPPGVVEIAGKSRSGKTTLGLTAIKYFQKQHREDGVAIILSSENRDNKQYAKKMGVDVDNVIIIKSKYVEDLFFKLQLNINYVKKIWADEKREGKPPIVIMWDSVGATLSRAEFETFTENVKKMEKSLEKGTKFEIDHAQVASFAKNAKMMVKAILGNLYEDNITLIAINHTGDKIGNMQKGRKSYGGEWVEYLPTIRLETLLIKHISLDDVEVAQITKIKIVKNDFGTREPAEIEILLGVGVVLSESDINFAVENGIITKEGTKFSFMGGKLTWKSPRTFYQLYNDGNKLLDILYSKIQKIRHESVRNSKKVMNDE